MIPKRREHNKHCYFILAGLHGKKNARKYCSCGAGYANQMHDEWVAWMKGIEWPEVDGRFSPHYINGFNEAIDQFRRAVEN